MTEADMRSVSERAAAFICSTRYDDLPPEAAEAARTHILDTLGVGIAGAASPESRTLRQAARGWGGGDDARAWGTGDPLPAPSAVLVNAHQAHCLEFDCVHDEAVVHVVTAVLPCVVAEGQRRAAAGRPVSGRDLVLAVCLGVEMASAVGLAATAGLRFFRPGTAGALGATAALASMRGLDAERTAHALSIAYGGLSGTMQPHVEGSGCLALQLAFNARAALSAVDLAESGHTGPRLIFEGPYGYYSVIEAAGDSEALLAELGGWHILRVSQKPFPSGRATHAGIDATLRLMERGGVREEDVTSVEAIVPPLVHRLVSRPATQRPDAGAARLSLPFQIASCLIDGRLGLDSVRDERLTDRRLLDVAARVVVRPDAAVTDPNALDPQTFVFTLRDGTRETMTFDRMLGAPEVPLDRERRLAKFRACLAYGAPDWPAGRGERIVELCESLDALADASELLDLV